LDQDHQKEKMLIILKVLRAIPWVFAWTQIRLMLPAWLGSAEALRYSYIKEFRKTLYDMERNWPFFNSMLRYVGYGNFKS
jgi:phosphoenolpyruvate carboxylase